MFGKRGSKFVCHPVVVKSMAVATGIALAIPLAMALAIALGIVFAVPIDMSLAVAYINAEALALALAIAFAMALGMLIALTVATAIAYLIAIGKSRVVRHSLSPKTRFSMTVENYSFVFSFCCNHCDIEITRVYYTIADSPSLRLLGLVIDF